MSVEIERKFLLGAEPDWSALAGSAVGRIEFEQVYLRVTEVEEKRIRRRTGNGLTSYEYAHLRTLRPGVRMVDEVGVDRAEYERLRADRDDSRQVVRKIRRTFHWTGRLYEVDHILEPARRTCWLLEVQVDREDDAVLLPEFLPVLREVTGEPLFRNAHIALG
ncbi:hypothetical protein ABZ816_29360 [Actinosynnema sp. NPDC047251]|uniref:CYTH domain-containing protein n=1 Tax=Saccharothrix espanaensis (strain ATCC 51144 / DSM 44229 / JCM 9112 / NBRC 15066 / NRRL 15764) TaxID=1179773 RepID=K0JRS9_SACES|nr:hypothetical protein [Saccharothrix espanaensis]CCH28496.1 hypothetical protein BN6_11700 [Saccharothrix espanaensis DSM 44229]